MNSKKNLSVYSLLVHSIDVSEWHMAISLIAPKLAAIIYQLFTFATDTFCCKFELLLINIYLESSAAWSESAKQTLSRPPLQDVPSRQGVLRGQQN